MKKHDWLVGIVEIILVYFSLIRMAAFHNGLLGRRYLVPILYSKGICVKRREKYEEGSKTRRALQYDEGGARVTFSVESGKRTFIKKGTSLF